MRQVYGDGKVLLDQLREVADLLADGFNSSGRSSRDLLNGLVQKVRARPSCVVAIEHHAISSSASNPSARPAPRPSESPSPPLPSDNLPPRRCDGAAATSSASWRTTARTAHPWSARATSPSSPPGARRIPGGPRRATSPRSSPSPRRPFLYLTGMVVPTSMRRRGVGRALLARTEAIAPKMRPRPSCVALHVDKTNDAARGCTRPPGSRRWTVGGTGAGGRGGGEGRRGAHGQLPARVPVGGLLGIGRKAASRNEVLMVKRPARGAGRRR